MLLHGLATKTNHKLVRTHFALIWCWDKPRMTLDSLDSPRPGLEGSHHLPPYSILCVTPREPHPNGTFSQDSQGGVPKLSRVGLPGLWELISLGSDLWLEWGLNQSHSSPRELFNALSHSFYRRWENVNSRLLVVESQTASLTPGPSFAHNLGYKCPNGSCKAILDIYTLRPFYWYKRTPQCKVFWPLQSSSELLGVPEDSKSPLLGVWVSSSHLAQSGVATLATLCNFGILTIFSLTWVVNAANRESSFCQSHLASTLSTCMEHFHSKPFICENWNNKLNRHYFIEQVLYVTTFTLGL
jgi:hypothetical protein